ncbi:U3 small nucleolar RNA-associated protein [Arachnomyces sp. PD_36]|nr:U3 small nucleolar RNA-associated protein [Arachnomyces sp. PD_36]
MDIHRCRFVPYNPQAINTLAFSHPPSADISGRGVPTLRLAVGRANGDIEIWNPLRGAWFQETILRGGKDRSIEGLAWTLDPSEDEGDGGGKIPGKLRLFSVGYSSVVTEWDLQKGQPAQHSSGNYGEIWCLTAQPRWKATKRGKDGKLLPPAEGEYTGQHLAAGCADGSIVILSTEDGELRYLKTMRPSTKRARVLSITFQDRNIIVAGYADSSIRLFDIRNGRLLRTMSLGKGPIGGPKEILVWSVKCLPDGTIVSGDSTGEIRFWDGKNYSIFQRLTGHQADILDIAVSADGKSIVSGGADQRTVIYRPQDGGGKGDQKRRWAELMHRRYHTHDVKTLAVYETKDISIVVSGGLDTTPIVLPLREYGNEHHRKLTSLPQLPQLSSSPSSRYLMSWWDREVNIWHVTRGAAVQGDVQDGRQHRLAGKILFKGDENLTSAALSSDGKLLVASTVSEIKAFSLKQRMGDVTANLKVQKIEVPSSLSAGGARLISISPDNQWLCVVRPNSDIYLANIVPASSSAERPQISSKLVKVKRVERHTRHEKGSHGTLGPYERTIRCIAFADDSKILASGDIGGYVDTWVLEQCGDQVQKQIKTNGRSSSVSSDDDDSSDDEDNSPVIGGQRWIPAPQESPIPRMKSGILFLSFRPRSRTTQALTNGNHTAPKQPELGEDRLMVLTGEHQLAEFNTLKGKLSDWSRRNPKGCLPAEFSGLKDRAMGALWDINGDRERLWLYGPNWMWMFDLSQDFPPPEEGDAEPVAQIDSKPALSNKRKRGKEIEDVQDRKKPNTGAGDRIPIMKSYIGQGDSIRKITGKDSSNAEVVSIRGKQRRSKKGDDDDDEADYYDEALTANELTLARLRRQQIAEQDDEDDEDQPQKVLTNGVKSHEEDLQIQNELDAEPGLELQPQPKRRWWWTYKYRDILGIVPLSSHGMEEVSNGLENAIVPANGDGGGDIGLEVAVVERPMWDVDLPGRYLRDYE